MKAKLRDAALQLVDRAAKSGHRGKTANKRLLAALVRDAKGRIPSWYVELITTVPICGLELGWQAQPPEADYDGIEWMDWSDPRNMRSESIECYPGLAILEHGYVNVASDLTKLNPASALARNASIISRASSLHGARIACRSPSASGAQGVERGVGEGRDNILASCRKSIVNPVAALALPKLAPTSS